jgi:ABC-type bacteriocin/lantibiotic exporter with double-glycine peptidase domain
MRNSTSPAVARSIHLPTTMRRSRLKFVMTWSTSIQGADPPESGSIYIDGNDLATVDVQAVRRQMGVVLQNSQLMAGDIFSNVAGASSLTIEAAWEALKMAGFDRDIRQLPMGIHTHINEGASTISGGQRQRLLIASALAGRPRILLFDEATSALDSQSQAIVSENLNRLQAMRIVIAHRLSTVQNADRIYVLESGEVVQRGTCAELMEQEGPFKRLARRQLL